MPLKTKMLEVVLDSNQKTEVVLDSDHEQDKNLLFDSTNCHSAQLNVCLHPMINCSVIAICLFLLLSTTT